MLISKLGSYSFFIAFFLNFIYYLSSFFIEKDNKKYKTFHVLSSVAFNSFIIISFLFFVLSFVYSDFSLYSVFANSHTAKPLIYKIGASWSSHEGSMLFWLFILAVYNIAYSTSRKNLEDFTVCHVQSFFQIIMQGFIWITVNPFKISETLIPNEGSGFNPLLQDYGLLIHPPILYLGYAGSLLSFSIIITSIFSKSKDSEYWVKLAKTWVLLPWAFLTLGIGLGSWWSYRELGWGGFWSWDPVESISLLPWLASLSFIHLTLIKDKCSTAYFLTKINCILIFIFSIFATFVVRSGIVTSLHSFATSNERGWYFLVLLGFFSLVGIGSVTFFDQNTKNANKKTSIRNKVLLLGAISLMIGYLIITFATIIPIYMYSFQNEIVNIGEKFYRDIFGILLIPFLIMIAFTPYIGLKKPKILFSSILLSIPFAFLSSDSVSIQPIIILFLVYFITFTYLLDFARKVYTKKDPQLSSFLGHLGVSLVLIGVTTSRLNDQNVEGLMNVTNQNSIQIHEYTAILKSVHPSETKDSVNITANFEIWYKNKELGTTHPKVTFYKIEKMQLPDSASFYHNLSDIYILVSGVDGDQNMLMVKVYYKKFIMLIWIGYLCTGISGIFGIFNKTKKFKKVQKISTKNNL